MMPRPPFMECPRYDRCSANVCPLDPAAHEKSRLPGEPVCGLAKSIRTRIGVRYPDLLPLGGLTSREAAGKRRWEQMTPEQRSKLKPHPEALARINAARQQQRRADSSPVIAVSHGQPLADMPEVHPGPVALGHGDNRADMALPDRSTRRAAS